VFNAGVGVTVILVPFTCCDTFILEDDTDGNTVEVCAVDQ
jgi:hypothetical protein